MARRPRLLAAQLARPRPSLHGLDATTTLRYFALVTFTVDPARLIEALPAALTPETRRLDDGREVAFVSAVSFRDVDFRFVLAPRIRASFFQTNYRAYVHGPDGRAVFFFGTTLDSRLVAIPRLMWQMPWHGGRTRLEARWADDGRCAAYRHGCTGRWGAADAEVEGTGEPAGRLDGFVDADDTAFVLTHPLDGYFLGRDGSLGRYAVWHERLRPQLGIARTARYAVFEDLGLVDPGAMPHSVLLQRAVDFDVLLPPTRA
jgi:uncharacterized protein YqjF (DUF2071 family)